MKTLFSLFWIRLSADVHLIYVLVHFNNKDKCSDATSVTGALSHMNVPLQEATLELGLSCIHRCSADLIHLHTDRKSRLDFEKSASEILIYYMRRSKLCTGLKSSQWDWRFLGSLWFLVPDLFSVFSISWAANLIFMHIAFLATTGQP